MQTDLILCSSHIPINIYNIKDGVKYIVEEVSKVIDNFNNTDEEKQIIKKYICDVYDFLCYHEEHNSDKYKIIEYFLNQFSIENISKNFIDFRNLCNKIKDGFLVLKAGFKRFPMLTFNENLLFIEIDCVYFNLTFIQNHNLHFPDKLYNGYFSINN